MKRLFSFAAIVLIGPLLGGCIQTQELPLAPNVIRLDTRASGILFAGSASEQTQRRAAQLTLQNGYSHFRFDQAQVSQGSQLAGVYSSGQANATGYGNNVMVTGSSTSSPIYAPTANVGVTVYMFHENEPGAQGAFDAAEVLKRLGA